MASIQAAFFLLVTMISPPGLDASGEAFIRIGGTGGALGGIKEVARAYQKKHPHAIVSIAPSLGSNGSIKAVLAGSLDIALSSRPENDEERRQGAVSREYGRTPIVFVTSAKGAPSEISLQELVSIYTGRFQSWPDGTPVRLILRPAGDTDYMYLREMSPEMNTAVQAALSREGMVTAVTDQENLDIIQRIRGGFGASTLAQVKSEQRPVKIFRLNGVTPSLSSLNDGSYSYYKCFFAVTGMQVRPEVQAFVDFLSSKQGRAILVKTGHHVGPFSSCRNRSCYKE